MGTIEADSLLAMDEAHFERWLGEQSHTLSGELVQAAKARAEAIIYQGNQVDALRLLERGARIAAALGDPFLEALVWRGRANVFYLCEGYEECLEAARHAAALYAQHGTPFDVAIARTVEVGVLGAMERFDEAIALGLWIRPHFEAAGFAFGQARLASALAQVYTWAWRLTEAQPEYERARTHYLKLGMALDAATVLHNMGVLAYRLDQLEQAQQYYRQAYPELAAAGDVMMMVKTQFNLAQLSLRCGQYESALAHLTQARNDLARLPDSPDHGYVALFEAQVRQVLNQPLEAERLLREALARFEGSERRLVSAETLLALSQLVAADPAPDRLAEALACLEQAEDYLRPLATPLLTAWVQLERGELLLRLGRTDEAIPLAEAAHTHFAAALLPLRHAHAAVLLADCCARRQPERARALYHDALAVMGAAIPLLTVRGWWGLGRLAHAAGEWVATEQAYSQAIALLDETRRALRSHSHQAGLLENKQALAEALLDTLQQQPGRVAEVLAWVERFKASALADLLAGQPPDHSADPALRDLLTQREALASELDHHLSAWQAGHDAPLSGATQRGPALAAHDAHQAAVVEGLRRRLHTLDEQVARRPPPAQAWREGHALDAPRIQALLDDETMLVAYYSVGGHLFALTATRHPDDLCIHPLRVSLTEIEQQWQQTRRWLLRPQSPLAAVRPHLAHLWQKLIAPLGERLRGARRLILLPHRSLVYLPFAGLYDAARQRYAVEEWVIQLAPSATVLAACQRQPLPDGPPLLVGYPGEPGQADYLPGVEQEISTIAALGAARCLVGDAATLVEVLAQAPGSALLHLAGHAFYNSLNPMESGMPLAGGRWLRASDLYLRWGHLRGTTVVLSGCETGRGQPSGGDVLGLTSAFLYAGAAGVLAGLWRIDDRATVHLMTTFYERLRQGDDAASALRQAQLTLLGSPTHAAPYFWAPFELMGASRALPTPPAQPQSRL